MLVMRIAIIEPIADSINLELAFSKGVTAGLNIPTIMMIQAVKLANRNVSLILKYEVSMTVVKTHNPNKGIEYGANKQKT